MSSPLAKLDPTRPPLGWLLRLPRLLYRARLGWLLGRRFVQLTVRGRRSGLPRSVVLEVIGRDPPTGDLLIASAWGRRAQWFRNLEACPRAEARVSRRCYPVEVTPLGASAAAGALRRYAREHPLAYRWFIGPLLLGRRPRDAATELDDVARVLPVLVLRPR